jgi:hypothetical protein
MRAVYTARQASIVLSMSSIGIRAFRIATLARDSQPCWHGAADEIVRFASGTETAVLIPNMSPLRSSIAPGRRD